MFKINTRFTTWIIVCLGGFVAFWLSQDVIGTASKLNFFSYWGTVATIIALVITVAEIFYSIQTTKSLHKQTEIALATVRSVEDASVLSDCIAAIDITSNAVMSERYDAALGSYQHFRKLCVRTIPGFHGPQPSGAQVLNELGELELKLISATRVNAAAGFNKKQKHEILQRLLTVKQAVELHNPANRN